MSGADDAMMAAVQLRSERYFLDRLDGLCRPAPSQKLQRFRFERVRRFKEFLQLLCRPRRQPPDVLKITLEGRTIRYNEDAVVSLLLALRRLQDFEHADGLARQNETWIRRRIVNDENIQGVAVFRFGGRDEAPIVGIGQSGKQRLRKGERAEFRIELELCPAAARCLNHRMDMVAIRPGREFQIVRHFVSGVSNDYFVGSPTTANAPHSGAFAARKGQAASAC